MTRKFKIGDIVQVVKCVNAEQYPLSDDFKVGHRGKVVYYDCRNVPHHHVVKRRNGNEQYFTAKELKLIKRARNEV